MKIDFRCPKHKKSLVERTAILRWQDDRVIERMLECPEDNCKYWVKIQEFNAPLPKLSKEEEKAIRENLKSMGLLKK